MPDKSLTMVETAVLFILLAEAGPVPNVGLAREHGCHLRKEQRDHLVILGLIQVERISGRLVLTLSERGWAYCRAQLAAGSAPAGSGAAGGALFAVLRRWDRYLTALQLSLGEFVNHSLPPVGSGSPEVNGRQALSERDVEDRVHAAYRAIAHQAGELVSLADLRDLVSDLIPADVDAALRRLHRRRGITLVPEANQKTLDTRARGAAVVIGDQPKHSIAMGAS